MLAKILIAGTLATGYPYIEQKANKIVINQQSSFSPIQIQTTYTTQLSDQKAREAFNKMAEMQTPPSEDINEAFAQGLGNFYDCDYIE